MNKEHERNVKLQMSHFFSISPEIISQLVPFLVISGEVERSGSSNIQNRISYIYTYRSNIIKQSSSNLKQFKGKLQNHRKYLKLKISLEPRCRFQIYGSIRTTG